MAKIREIKMYIPQGTTYEHTFYYAKSYLSDGTPVDPINITGYAARMQWRPTVESDVLIYDVTDVSGELVCGDGTVVLTIPDDISAAFTFDECVGDLEIESPAGKTIRLVKLKNFLDLEVTR